MFSLLARGLEIGANVVYVCMCVSSQPRKGPLCPGPCLGPRAAPHARVCPFQLASGLQKKALLLPRLMLWAHCPGRNKDCGFKLSDQAALPSRKDRPPWKLGPAGGRRGTREKGDREPLKVTN